jgi:hypothetical protein
MADHVFAGDRVVLDLSFDTGRARLAILARDGVLLRACDAAYRDGIADLAQAAGSAAALSRLAAVRLAGLADTDHCARFGLRARALAADGRLFTAPEADLMLTPAGEEIMLLTVAGTYQPGWAGAGLDQGLVHRCAATTIRSFLARIACALVHPAGATGPAGASPPRRPSADQEP